MSDILCLCHRHRHTRTAGCGSLLVGVSVRFVHISFHKSHSHTHTLIHPSVTHTHSLFALVKCAFGVARNRSRPYSTLVCNTIGTAFNSLLLIIHHCRSFIPSSPPSPAPSLDTRTRACLQLSFHQLHSKQAITFDSCFHLLPPLFGLRTLTTLFDSKRYQIPPTPLYSPRTHYPAAQLTRCAWIAQISPFSSSYIHASTSRSRRIFGAPTFALAPCSVILATTVRLCGLESELHTHHRILIASSNANLLRPPNRQSAFIFMSFSLVLHNSIS